MSDDRTGDFQLVAQLVCGLGPSSGISIELVIDVDRLQVELQLWLELLQGPGESGRVGSPGEGDQDSIANAEVSVLREKRLDFR